jgi:hypothetical protein
MVWTEKKMSPGGHGFDGGVRGLQISKTLESRGP